METIKNDNKLFNLDNDVGYALLNAICGASPKTQRDFEDVHNKDEDFEVELKINGVEHRFSDIIRRWKENYNHAIERGVKKLFERKYAAKFNELSETVDELIRAVKNDIKKRFPEFEDYRQD